ncbi:MAG: hypothetical protein ABI397_02510 [Candidatus Saccharimonas sp.]
MYTLKSIVKRGVTLSAGLALVASSILPVAPAFADSLNPLTARSLTLSSSSPGWDFMDGAGNSQYAPPNSGTNGQKTGNTFSFKVSTNSSPTGTNAPIKAMTLQYCVTPAGNCVAPGDDAVKGTDTTTTTDLNVKFPSPVEIEDTTKGGVVGDFNTVVNTTPAQDTTGDVVAVPGYAGYDNGKPVTGGFESGIGGAAAAITGNYVVYYNDAGTWTQSKGWVMTASSLADTATPANNYITLTNSTGLGVLSGTEMKVVFFGTDNNYITNPGSGAFFVRMNTYNSDTVVTAANVIDGGVTVANVMNQSIWIQTKVLETMQFSVGTVDPNSLDSSNGSAVPGSTAPSTLESGLYADTSTSTGITKHGSCDRILGNITPDQPTNVLKLGNQTSESSLETDHTYSTHSYWRLSSNSSAGATVYYSGHTLTNTSGDEIQAIGPTKALPIRGSEQFGLALDNTDQTGSSKTDLQVSYAQEATYENGNDVGLGLSASTTSDNVGSAAYHAPTLFPLQPADNYSQGTGVINGTPTAMFAFVRTSDTVPVPLASESTEVVDCVTGKMRYIANIAATTPAGIYTTKVNYIAAPQY